MDLQGALEVACATQRQLSGSVAFSLPRLCYPDSTIDIISAPCLHKDVQDRSGGSQDWLESYLKECNRVLRPGGRMDYIFFESELCNSGPLTTELEYYLWETWARGGALDEMPHLNVRALSSTAETPP